MESEKYSLEKRGDTVGEGHGADGQKEKKVNIRAGKKCKTR